MIRPIDTLAEARRRSVEAIEAAKRFLYGRAGSYRRVFAGENRDAAAVMRDLAKFCRAFESTAHPDPHIAARLDGRREVWLRIQEHIRLPDATLWQMYHKEN